jgi:hypothetical protein
MLNLILPNEALVIDAYASLIGYKPGSAALESHQAFIVANGAAAYKAALNDVFAASTNAELATAMLANLSLTAKFTQADAEAYLAANATNRVGAIMDLAAQLRAYAGADALLVAAKAGYMADVSESYTYSVVTANASAAALSTTPVNGQTYDLGTGIENLTGTAFNDVFLARSALNSNTLQDSDKINGGAGTDTLIADLVANTGGVAITPVMTGIETVVLRSQSSISDPTNGNNLNTHTVQIDAQRSLAVDNMNTVTAESGVTWWESNNSRSDVIIEDVRIGNLNKTSDVTIAFVESDPGNVDFGVYFDQHSLRNTGSNNSTITIKLMDTGAAAGYNGADTTKPLLNNPYDTFKFLIGGVQYELKLNPAGSTTVASSADTYPQLLAAIQAALVGTGVTAALGATFTIPDPLTGNNVTGTSIVLTGSGASISTNDLSGWYNTLQAPVPADANIYNKFEKDSTSTTELVTSKVVLDDVGRGSTGGDLVIGGLSVGETSTSRGVERFEIEVRDNSKLQTINSTNNALREVTIVSGATSKTNQTDGAYSTTVLNEGDLTVWGNAKNSAGVDQGVTGNNQNMDGANEGATVAHQGAFAVGFTDVRLIDASAFKGKLAFTAAITQDSITKYVNLADTQSSPTGDVANAGNTNFNIPGANFDYIGGNDNDTMVVSIDSLVAASRTLSGRHDFTIALKGNDGNDTITTNIGGLETDAWYADQKQNANITIDGGSGNDRITTTGAGDVIINAGTGDDVVFADNSGVVGAVWNINAVGAAPDQSDLKTNGAVKGFLFNGQLTVAFSGAGAAGLGGGVTAGAADSIKAAYTNGFEKVVTIPTGDNYGVTQLHINQAIKDAINNDAVLKELLSATDGPANTLVITSKIDGAFNANDLRITISAADLTGLSVNDQATALTAYKVYAKDSTAVIANAQAAAAATVVAANDVTGMDDTPVLAANGAISTAIGSDNKIDLGTGSDLVVLGTGANSNDTLVFTGYDLGKKTVVNFQDGAVSNTDYLNFDSYLNNKTSLSGSTVTEKTIAVSLNADAVVEANSVTVLKGIFTTTQTYASLSESALLAAVNSTNTGTANYANISASTLDASTGYITSAGANNLAGGIGKAVVMVENDANEGQYKVFELTFSGLASNANKDFTGAKLIADVDFGNTVDYAVGLLNGTAAVGGVLPPDPIIPGAITLTPGTTAAVAATAAADVFSFNAVAAKALVPNTQISVTGFAVAADSLVFDTTTASPAVTKLSALAGIDGISVTPNAITNQTDINFGPDANGDVVVISLAGIVDPTLVNISVI